MTTYIPYINMKSYASRYRYKDWLLDGVNFHGIS